MRVKTRLGVAVTCPAPESLLSLALGGGADDPTTARHVEGCPVCQAEVASLQEAASAVATAALSDRRVASTDCLDEFAIADFVEGRLTGPARGAAVEHLLECAHCRLTVRGTGRLIADPAMAILLSAGHTLRPAARLAAPRRRRRTWVIPAAAAAAAVLLFLRWPRTGSDDRAEVTRLRESPVTAVAAPTPIAPRSSVARVDSLVWTSAPGVERYRVRLYDATGTVLWSAQPADTVVGLPGDLSLAVGRSYFWRVEAETEWQKWAGADLVEFRITGFTR